MKRRTVFSKTIASVRKRLTAAGAVLCIAAVLVPVIPAAAAEQSQKALDVTVSLEQVFEVPEETGNLKADTRGTYKVSTADDDTRTALDDGIIEIDGASDGVLELTLDGNATSDIKMSFNKVGIYKFLIEQTTDDTDKDAYIYDDTTYTATVAVENGENGLSFKKVIVLNNVTKEKVDEIVFENKFGPCFIDPPIQKKVVDENGNPASTDETFYFQMKADDPSWPMPEGSKNGLKEMSIQGSGSVEFGDIWYDKVGTYTYKVYEVEGDNEDIDYDTNIRYLTVTVTKGENGLEAKREYSGQNKQKAVFANKLKKKEEHHHHDPEPDPPKPTPTPEPEKVPEVVPTTGGKRTGDDRHMLLWGGICGAAVIAGGIWFFLNRRKGS